jgi:hypothetical protein
MITFDLSLLVHRSEFSAHVPSRDDGNVARRISSAAALSSANGKIAKTKTMIGFTVRSSQRCRTRLDQKVA